MKLRLIRVLSATALLVGLGAAPAAAQSFTLTAKLTGAGEGTPTANGINTAAFGDATIVVNMTTRTVTYTVNVFK